LLERQPDRRIDDEQTDDKGQQPECGQVEVKTVGEAFEIALGTWLDQAQFFADDRFERRMRAFDFADQQAGHLIRHVEEPLRDADVNHQHPGHQLRLRVQRRQRQAAARHRHSIFRKIELAEHLRRDQCFSRRRQKRLQVRLSDRRRIAHFSG
jgi:hypothetical protein